jgi:hypothetical protein
MAAAKAFLVLKCWTALSRPFDMMVPFINVTFININLLFIYFKFFHV